MDVTHIPEFGKLGIVHVTVDTFSGYICATPSRGKTVKHVISHMYNCFAIMGIPNTIKTDNGPAYSSYSFSTFCSQWSIKHITGIPYNPQGQEIIEHTHLTLKNMILNQKGEGVWLPKDRLNQALCTLNFLNIKKDDSITAVEKHWSK